MAKTFHKPIDKVERQARLAGRNNIKNDRREARNLNRMGWQDDVIEGEYDEDQDLERGDEL